MRRNLLLSMVANSYKWLPYSYEYLFHNLIPEKIATFNKWNEETQVGIIDNSGNYTASGNRICSKDFIEVVPSTTYYRNSNIAWVFFYDVNKTFIDKLSTANDTITTPFNCCYMKFYTIEAYGTTYNHDICINESNASLNGTYIPYKPRYVKDKSKFAKFEGNSEVVNQLFDYTQYPTYSFNGITYTNNNDGSYTLSGTASANSYYTILDLTSLVDNHYYLIYGCASGGSTSSYMIRVANGQGGDLGYDTGNGIIVKNTSGMAVYMRVINGTALSTTKKFVPQIIDLGKQYPFDTHATLTDSRVQNIIRKGYIPYNTGEIKDTDMGGIVSESFNIWNEEWELGKLSTTTGNDVSSSSNIRSKGYIRILPNTEYYYKVPSTIQVYNVNICYYDANKTFISFSSGATNPKTSPSNATFMRIYLDGDYGTTYNHNICINRSSSLNGTYKPHDDFVDLAHFNPIDINGIHDEFKALDSGYLFRKKTLRVDLGSLTWIYETTGNTPYFTSTGISTITKKPVSNYVKADLNCSLENQRAVDIRMNGYYGIAIDDVGNIRCALENMGTDPATFKTMVSGIMLDFPLASEQTTNMPLRHLGMVDLNNATWTLSEQGYWYSDNVSSTITKPANNSTLGVAYSDNYILDTFNNVYAKSKVNSVGVQSTGRIAIYNGSSTTQPTGYLYYETADITDETDILTYTGTLPLAYQGSGFGTSHDTMEETDTEWVFTRNNWWVDLGTLNYGGQGTPNCFYTTIPLMALQNPNNPNLLCDKYTYNYTAYASMNNLEFRVDNNIILGFKNTSCSTTTEMKTAMSGIPLKYQLATPQITRIPKKYINFVDLGTLTWWKSTSGTAGTFYASLPNDSSSELSALANSFCFKLMNVGVGKELQLADNQCCLRTDNHYIFAKIDSSITTSDDFKKAVSGFIAYYQTATESTLPDTFSIQAGGEVSSYAFEWVENQIQKVLSTNNFNSLGTSSFVVNDDIATITKGATGVSGIYQSNYIDNTHKYLAFADIKLDDATSYQNVFLYSRSARAFCSGTTNWQTLMLIFQYNDTSGNTSYPRVQIEEAYTGTNVQVKNFNFIDLTQAFGSGNEPTSISDPLIQRIIKKGYIPTNTNGTLVYEETEVLPNATFSFRSK